MEPRSISFLMLPMLSLTMVVEMTSCGDGSVPSMPTFARYAPLPFRGLSDNAHGIIEGPP